jgi:tetratricopeptide (TPR) repeat protein
MRLADCEDEDRWFLVERWKEFQHPGLAELLCHESAEAASDRSDRALRLAKLAHRISELIPGDSARKKRLQGYALFFLANAVRVSGDLPTARKTFNEAHVQWVSAEKASTFLAAWRVLDLEASLLRDERQPAQALARLEDASKAAPHEWLGRLLLSKSAIFEQMGLGEQAVEVLREAADIINARQQPRLYFGVRFNLAANLCLLDQFEEPQAMLLEIQALAEALQLELHIVRVQWLTGRVAAGQNRLDEAAAHLEEVRQEFAERRSAWDCSLVTLELATVHLRQGRTASVRSLAGELVWIFEAQGVHREALAALALFQEAAERDAATLDLTERLVRYLRKAQGDPELRFGPADRPV